MPIIGPDATPPATDGCDSWVNPGDLPCTVLVEAADEEVVVDVCTLATDLLWALSGRQFGPGCPVTIRPCDRRWCAPLVFEHMGWLPYYFLAYETGVEVLGSRCDPIGHTIDLAQLSPIYDIVSVTIDGDPFTDYRLDNGRHLLRTDGDRWPRIQDVEAADTEADTFAIHLRPGRPLPAAGLRAVKVLACELLRARLKDGSCRLPAKAQTAARQGVTVNLDELPAGRFGLDEVDHFLDAYNPKGLAGRSSVWSPDLPRHRVTP